MNSLIILIKKDISEYLRHLYQVHQRKCINDINFIDYLKVRRRFPIYKVILTMRICNYLDGILLLKPIFYLYRIKYRKLQLKYGFQCGYKLNPGGGFFIGHYGGIVIHQDAKIGEYVIIHQNTTIGTTDRGVPTILDGVNIGANCCIIGNTKIGRNCIIGAGSVVTKSFPENSIVVGNPGHCIGMNKGDRLF